MKTIVFALQVFSLLAFLPVCMTMELNHATKPQIVATAPKVEAVQDSTDSSLEFSNAVGKYPLAAIAFSKVKVKEKKKSSSTGCSCQDCKCGASCTCHDF
jgi:hypothetical protein